MTPEEFLNQFCKPDDYNKLEEQLKDGLWTNNVLIYMRDYARLMCDKQKEICARNALIKQEYKNNNEEVVMNSMQIYNIDKYDSYYFDVEIYADSNSILNAPYPDELQGNN